MGERTLNIILVVAGIIVLAFVIQRYRDAKADGRAFTFDDLLSTPTTTGIQYKDGKCYNVKYNSITGQSTSTEISITDCYKTKAYQNALVDEYNGIQLRLATPPNNSDPNDAILRAQWVQRAMDIKVIFKTIKGCNVTDDFNMTTLTCVPMV